MSDKGKPYTVGDVTLVEDTLYIDVYIKVPKAIPYFEMSLTAEDLNVSEEEFIEIAEDIKIEVDKLNNEEV